MLLHRWAAADNHRNNTISLYQASRHNQKKMTQDLAIVIFTFMSRSSSCLLFLFCFLGFCIIIMDNKMFIHRLVHHYSLCLALSSWLLVKLMNILQELVKVFTLLMTNRGGSCPYQCLLFVGLGIVNLKDDCIGGYHSIRSIQQHMLLFQCIFKPYRF